MTQALFWLALPCLLPQAVWVRRVTPRFRAPTQTLQGRFGTAPKLRVVGIGDSIIAGVGASTAERTLTAALANALHRRLSVDTEWSAFGKIGADTAKISRQVAPRLPVNGADLVLISAGVNDITGLRRRRDWLTSIEQLLTTITTRCPRAVVLIQVYHHSSIFQRYRRRSVIYSAHECVTSRPGSLNSSRIGRKCATRRSPWCLRALTLPATAFIRGRAATKLLQTCSPITSAMIGCRCNTSVMKRRMPHYGAKESLNLVRARDRGSSGW